MLQARAIDYLVENADYDGLTRAPNELKHLAYRVAIWKGISCGEKKFTSIAVVVDTEELTPPEYEVRIYDESMGRRWSRPSRS